MKRHLSKFIALVGTIILLAVTSMVAYASRPHWIHTDTVNTTMTLTERSQPQAASCTKLEVTSELDGDTSALWYAQDEDGEVIPEPIDSYPKETMTIIPGFTYSCMPSKTTLLVVFYFPDKGQDPQFMDRITPDASSSEGLFTYPLSRDDETPMWDGTWQVEFYLDGKKVIADGEIVVGSEDNVDPQGDVTVTGVVKDKKTEKPIKGAAFYVLNPGVNMDQWDQNNYSDDDIYAYAETDSKGKFELDKMLTLDETYTVACAAKNYQGVYSDDFVITEDDPNPYELDITLSKK